MITESFALKLIEENEASLLDFKETYYDYQEKKSRTDFIKDLLTIANSTLVRKGYIICGVNKNKELVGVPADTDADDRHWIPYLNQYISHPIDFSIQKLFLSSKDLTIIVIEVSDKQQRPILCIKEYEQKLLPGVIYFRHGSTNDVARDLVVIEKMILNNETTAVKVVSQDPTYNKYAKFPPAPYFNFVGRTDEISNIFGELINHHKNYLLALTGDGGVGKTSIAYRVAEQIKNDIEKNNSPFDDVLWISAKDQRIYYDERRKLEREFNSLEDLYNKILLLFYDYNYILNLNIEQKYKLVKDAMETNKFFFVLDNLEVFKKQHIEEIKTFIKNAPFGHKFLITTRHDLRVQEFVPIPNLPEGITRDYITDVSDRMGLPVEVKNDMLSSSFAPFYTLTGGNPLYIKFFVGQMIRGKKLQDILARRKVESEKPLKLYCFDTTLLSLNDNELVTIYALAASQTGQLLYNELRYCTSLESSNLECTIENLTAVSMLTPGIKNGDRSFSINELLKSYLFEEKRIPGASLTRLTQKLRKMDTLNIPLKPELAFNFGLENITNPNEVMSYNAVLNAFEENALEGIQGILSEMKVLYPGNYLICIYNTLVKIKQHSSGNSSGNVLLDMNVDFLEAEKSMGNNDERLMMYAWKCILYMMLGKYDDVVQCLQEGFGPSKHTPLLELIQATSYHQLAYREFNASRFGNHDTYREIAEDLFKKNIHVFQEQPYFFFIKRGILFAYNQHIKHQHSEEPQINEKGKTTKDFQIFWDLRFIGFPS